MMSLKEKIWKLPEIPPAHLQEFFPHSSFLELQLLFNRGLQTQEQIEEFLKADFVKHVYDSAILKGSKTAVERIFHAMEKKEKILIFGDFDVDGVTASVILKKTFDFLNYPAEVYIPHRESEGHGLREESMRTFAKDGVNLIITVDCGISNWSEVEIANANGIDVIITDHHEIPEILPKAHAIINPKQEDDLYPWKFLSGAAVAFKLACLLVERAKNSHRQKESFKKWLLDVVALGIIGDCVPLHSENRTLVKFGLMVLNKTRRLGLQALIEDARCKMGSIKASDVAFRLVPRLNAASRLKHGELAFQLLSTDSPDQARLLSRLLNRLNAQRQELTEQIVGAARAQIERKSYGNILYAIGTDWSVGLNGIVASRIMEEFHRPVIIMNQGKEQTSASGRSNGAIDITKTISQGKHLLSRFGGHPGACGFSLKNENVEEFLAIIQNFARENIQKDFLIPRFKIDAIIDFDDVHWDFFNVIQKFEPFGQDNPEPLFLAKAVTIGDVRKIGQKGDHISLTLRQGNKQFRSVGFYFGDFFSRLAPGSEIDVVFRLLCNEWNGNRNLELQIVDMKIKGSVGQEVRESRDARAAIS